MITMIAPDGKTRFWIPRSSYQWESNDPEELNTIKDFYPITAPSWDPISNPDNWVEMIAEKLGWRTEGEPEPTDLHPPGTIF